MQIENGSNLPRSDIPLREIAPVKALLRLVAKQLLSQFSEEAGQADENSSVRSETAATPRTHQRRPPPSSSSTSFQRRLRGVSKAQDN